MEIQFGFDIARGHNGEDLFYVGGYVDVEPSAYDEELEYEVIIEDVERYGVAVGEMLPVDNWNPSDWECSVRDQIADEWLREQIAEACAAMADEAADYRYDRSRGL